MTISIYEIHVNYSDDIVIKALDMYNAACQMRSHRITLVYIVLESKTHFVLELNKNPIFHQVFLVPDGYGSNLVAIIYYRTQTTQVSE